MIKNVFFKQHKLDSNNKYLAELPTPELNFTQQKPFQFHSRILLYKNSSRYAAFPFWKLKRKIVLIFSGGGTWMSICPFPPLSFLNQEDKQPCERICLRATVKPHGQFHKDLSDLCGRDLVAGGLLLPGDEETSQYRGKEARIETGDKEWLPRKPRAELTTTQTQYVTEGSLMGQSCFSCRPSYCNWNTQFSGKLTLYLQFLDGFPHLWLDSLTLILVCVVSAVFFFFFFYCYRDENTISEAEMKCVS